MEEIVYPVENAVLQLVDCLVQGKVKAALILNPATNMSCLVLWKKRMKITSGPLFGQTR